MYRFLNKAIFYVFVSLFAATPFIFASANSELFEVPKMYFVYTVTVVILGFWAAKSVLAGKIIFRRTFLDIPLLIFLLTQTVSTGLSIDPYTSIFGYYSRLNGGLLSLVSYCFLYWAFVSNVNKKQLSTIIYSLIASAGIVSVWAILERTGFGLSCLFIKGYIGNSCWAQDASARVFATLGQPNWLAAYLVAVMPLAWVKIRSDKKLLWSGVSIVLFIALIFTNSRSGLLGFGAAFLLFWVFASIIRNSKFIIRPFLLLAASSVLLIALVGIVWISKNNQMPGVTPSENIRLIVWQGTVDAFLARPLLGWGPETFAYTYYQFRPQAHNLTSEWNLLYNKAHNEYLGYLANTGIVGIVTYLFVIFSIIKNFQFSIFSFHSNYNLKLVNLALASGWASILVTNFFGFSTVTTNLLFFLYPGIAIAMHNKEQTTYNIDFIDFRLSWQKIVLLSFVLCSTFYILSRLAGLWYADSLYAQARVFNVSFEQTKALEKLEQAIKIVPKEARYWDEMADAAGILAVAYFENQEEEKAQEWADLAKDAQDQAIQLNPYHVPFYRSRAAIFKRMAAIDPEYMQLAISALEQAILLAPTDPALHYNLGVLYDYAGEEEKAVEIIKRALKLKPDYKDAKEALEKLEN